MKECLLAFCLIVAPLVNVVGQQQEKSPASPTSSPSPLSEPAPSSAPTPPARPLPEQKSEDDSDVVRITTNLMQVDATVTDRDGKQVTDLSAADFEIMENGRPQTITNFSYITPFPSPTSAATSGSPGTSKGKDPLRAFRTGQVGPLRPEQVRRALALVVDDLRMSVESVHATRQALTKFVDEQTQQGDLVAIIRTSGGMGALQQFTTDREQLHAAIERVRPTARAQPGAFTSVNMLTRLETQISEGIPADNISSADLRKREGSSSAATQATQRTLGQARTPVINELRDLLFTVGTLGALNFVVRGLKDLPGRKAVVLFSDGIAIFNTDSSAADRNDRVVSAMKQLVDHANRASVVFYAIDTRGLQPTLFASDNTSGGPRINMPSGPPLSVTGIGDITPDLLGQQVLGARTVEIFEGQNGLSYLAGNTGGLAVFNNNDLNKGIRRALDDIGGYYLIGYRPDESTFDLSGHPRFNTWTIKVKDRPNLRVRTRNGFVGIAEESSRGRNRTPGEQLMEALLSPFSARGIDLKLTSFFMNDATIGSRMRSVILLDASKLTFTKQPDGRRETSLDVIAVTLGDSGQVIDQVTRVEKVNVSQENYERFLHEGMVYGFNVPISKPGAYILRIAVRDSASGRLGSASQFIEVPNVSKEKLSLSSLVIAGNNIEGRPKTSRDLVKALLAASKSSSSSAAPASASASEASSSITAGGQGMIGTEDPLASPASRRFRSGMFLNFACIVYNGKEGKSKNTQYQTQARLFHDGQEVFVGDAVPLDMTQQTDMTRLVVARRLYLGTVLTPGDYILHLTVSEAGRSGNPRVATRWIDFTLDN
jgi:VWFA-related protein